MQTWRPALLLAVLLTGPCTALRAAETWVQPERAAATPGARLRFEVVTADEFDAATSAVAAERIARITGRVGGTSLPLGEARTAEHALQIEATLSQPGLSLIHI